MSFIKILIKDVRERYGVDIFTYSICYNHLHFYLRICHRTDGSRAMQYILSKVALFINRILERRGTYWEDRYFSSPKKTAAEIRRTLHYILNQAKNCSPFKYRCHSIYEHPHYPFGIPKEVLNLMGSGNSEEKLRLIIEKNEMPYPKSMKVRPKSEYMQPYLISF
jgi:REP element-mobilizing transposase RayT